MYGVELHRSDGTPVPGHVDHMWKRKGYKPRSRSRASVLPMTESSPHPSTEWSASLLSLVNDVLGSPEASPELDLILATVRWIRDNPTDGRILLGDLTKGY